MKTTRFLQNIALGLLRGDIICDWVIENDEDVCDTFQGIRLLSTVDHLILQTQDIGMIYEYATKEMPGKVFDTFQALTRNEALQVAEMYTRYRNLKYANTEVVIPPHE